jgi:hypothetical protein
MRRVIVIVAIGVDMLNGVFVCREDPRDTGSRGDRPSEDDEC